MSFQVNGNEALKQQQNQLQVMEIEVIDCNPGDATKKDVTLRSISTVVTSPIQVKAIDAPADLAASATHGAG